MRGNEVVKISCEDFKNALKQHIDNISVDDHVVFNIVFEKRPGSDSAEKYLELIIDKNGGIDEDEE